MAAVTETTKTISGTNGQKQKHRPQQRVVTGRAKKVLDKFQNRVKELQQARQFKPDMVAYKELKDSIGINRVHGSIMEDEIPVGLILEGRGEAAILGIHCNILSGIDAIREEPCFAVCISGGYADDEHYNNRDDGTIIYTGAGGQDKKKRQVEDQTQTYVNKSLIASYETDTPIRVLSGKFGSYTYNGVYKCIKYSYEPSVDGPMVYKFTLQPIPGKSIPVAMSSSVGRSSSRKRPGKAAEALRSRTIHHHYNNGAKVRLDSKVKQRKLESEELYPRQAFSMMNKSNSNQVAKRRESNVENVNNDNKRIRPHLTDETLKRTTKDVPLKEVGSTSATTNHNHNSVSNNNNNSKPLNHKKLAVPKKKPPGLSAYLSKL